MRCWSPPIVLCMSFSGDKVVFDRSIDLPLSAGGPNYQKALMVKFFVMDAPLIYNIFLGWPTLNELKILVFTHHLLMKFLVGDDVGDVRADQYEAKQCYAPALLEWSSSIAEVHTISSGPPFWNALVLPLVPTPTKVQIVLTSDILEDVLVPFVHTSP